jgi:hypothetical protein
MLHADKNEFSDARRLYLEALSILEKTLPPDHPNIQMLRNHLAEIPSEPTRLSPSLSF